MLGHLNNDSSVILYKVEIELTEKGFKYVPNIVECVYNYIELTKNNELINVYDELKIINHIIFDYYQ